MPKSLYTSAASIEFTASSCQVPGLSGWLGWPGLALLMSALSNFPAPPRPFSCIRNPGERAFSDQNYACAPERERGKPCGQRSGGEILTASPEISLPGSSQEQQSTY